MIVEPKQSKRRKLKFDFNLFSPLDCKFFGGFAIREKSDFSREFNFANYVKSDFSREFNFANSRQIREIREIREIFFPRKFLTLRYSKSTDQKYIFRTTCCPPMNVLVNLVEFQLKKKL